MSAFFILSWVACGIIALAGLVWYHINDQKVLTALGLIGYIALCSIPVLNWLIAIVVAVFFLSSVNVVDRRKFHG